MGVLRSRVYDELAVQAEVVVTEEQARELALRGQTVPRPCFVHLLIDTGARYSSLTPEVLGLLGSAPRRRVRVQTHVGETLTSYYEVRMEFPLSTLAALPRVVVVRLDMPPLLADYYDGVIGRDVLRLWATLYDGPPGRLAIRDTPSLWGWLFS
jgi:hypothetical protein